MKPTFADVQGIAADLFEVPADQLPPDASPEKVETWDSVQHLNLIVTLEEKYGVQFAPEEIDGMKSLGQIASMLEQKVGQ